MVERDTRRVFFALWPDAAALDAFGDAARLAATSCGGRRMRRDTLHLTLAFIGAVTGERLASLRDAANHVRAAPIDVTLDCVGWWRHNRILWAGCRTVPPGLLALHASLSQELALAGFPGEDRAFAPHVTLARNINCELPLRLDRSINWRALEFTLVESRLSPGGARYCVLDRWPLLGR